MKSSKAIIITIISMELAGCAKVMPLSYKNHTGSDAATLYVLNREGNVGTIYLASYTHKTKKYFYKMTDRYVLDANFFQAKGNIVVSKVKLGVLYSVSQIKNKGKFLINSDSSFIPDAEKYYYIA